MSFSKKEAVGTSARAGGEDTLPAGVPLLFIDASAPLVQTGLWQDGCWLAHRASDAPALEEIFRSVSLLLAEAKLSFADIGGFVHNEGPGSILGIRLGAMAIRVWMQRQPQAAGIAAKDTGSFSDAVAGAESAGCALAAEPLPVWAVRSLSLVAAKAAWEKQALGNTVSIGETDSGLGSYTLAATCSSSVFSEFRQGLWNWFTQNADDVFGDSIEVIETEELAERLASAPQPCLHLRHRKNWEAPPGAVLEADTNLRNCPQVLLLAGLLRRVPEPEALLTRAPEFKTASGERHRGVTPQPAPGGETQSDNFSNTGAANAQS